METIDNIVCEMRKDIPRVVDAKVILRNYADRIEAAAEAEQDYYKKGFRSLMILTEDYKNELDTLGTVYRTSKAFSNENVKREVLYEN